MPADPQFVKLLVSRHEWAHKGCMDLPSSVSTEFSPDVQQHPYALNCTMNKLWDEVSAKIRYVFVDGGNKQKRKVRLTCKEWEKWANVHFIEVQEVKDAQIRIAFRNDGNWSWVSKT
jgi:hypothetical protein